MGHWFGKNCSKQICQFEKDCDGVEDKSYPVLVFCNHEDNPDNCEGNCNEKNCPIYKNKKDKKYNGKGLDQFRLKGLDKFKLKGLDKFKI